MRFVILLILLIGAGLAYFQPALFNAFAGAALIVLGAAVITRGRHG